MNSAKPFSHPSKRLEISHLLNGEAEILERVQLTRSRAMAIVRREGATLLVTLTISNTGEIVSIIGNSIMGYGSLRDLSEALGRVATAIQPK